MHSPSVDIWRQQLSVTMAYGLLLNRFGAGVSALNKPRCVGMLCAGEYLGHRLVVVCRRYQEGPNRWPRSFRPRR